jgi:hypothetical protein
MRVLSRFAFPVDEMDFRFTVKAYLGNHGQTIGHYTRDISFIFYVKAKGKFVPVLN